MNTDTIIVRFSVAKQIFGLLLFVGLGAVCGYALFTGHARSQAEEAKLWIGLVIMAGFSLYMVTRLLNRQPRLIIDQHGIHNPIQWTQPLPWAKVRAVRLVTGYKKVPRISFAGPNPAEYVQAKVLNSKPNFFKPDPTRKLSHDIFADLGGLDRSTKGLTQIIMSHLPHLTLERK